MTNLKKESNILLTCAASMILAGCLTGGETDSAGGPSNPSDNNPPLLSGIPQNIAIIGNAFSFRPTASDPDGDSLVFSIENRPPWASFDSNSGTLSGVPNLGDEGTYSNILITVSDGSSESGLPRFSVDVRQLGDGAAFLTWMPPTENNDGSTLTDLAGYKIYYGTSQGVYPNQVRIDNPGLTNYIVENLAPDTYYFVSTAFNNQGIESGYSNVAVKTVN